MDAPSRPTRIWAHRGASAHAPENTIAAFQLALEQGAEGVEFDVQLSADGQPVVIHDETLERTTNGTGRVVDNRLAELQTLDASGGRPGFAGVTIPTLAQVLDLLAPTEVSINIELKNSEQPYPGLEELVVAAVAARGLTSRVVLSSFSDDSVRRLAAMQSGCELATIYTDPQLRPWRQAAELGATAIHPSALMVFGRTFVNRARLAGVAVRPWVVNTPSALRRVFGYGVDAVFTDVPDVALQVRNER